MVNFEKFNSIKTITDNDLCVSCGACKHICPFANIELEYNDYKGKWDAEVKNTDKCLKCDGKESCLYVCPSYEMDYMELFDSNKNNLLGKIKNIYNGYSTDDNIRFESSSGGGVRELCSSLLKTNEIDGAISVTHCKGLDYIPSRINDVSEMANSIYHNINYENAFKILKENNGKFLLIGLPCQITSIDNLLSKKKYSYLKDRVYAKVALICGYSFDRINAKAFAYYNKFELKEISYREKGRYRKTRISNKFKSRVFDVLNPKTFNELTNNRLFFDKFLIQNGCLYCVDHIGYAADLVVGDAWQRRYQEDKIGTNILLSRTEKGEALISKVNNFHFEEGFKDEIVESQSVLYALGSLGEGMKGIKFKDKSFYPNHKRTENLEDIKIYKLKTFDLIKIKSIKKLLRERKFKLAKVYYVIIEFKTLIRCQIQNTLKRNSLNK